MNSTLNKNILHARPECSTKCNVVECIEGCKNKKLLLYRILRYIFEDKNTQDERKKINSGFSLLELLITIAIIGLLSAVIVPNLQRPTPRYEREAFVARFNTLVQYGWQQSLITHQVQRITVDVGKKIISLATSTGEKDNKGELIFKPIADAVDDTEIVIPDQIQIKQFFIEGFDMMTKFARSKTASVWFYIVPEGMTQNVVINFLDTKDVRDDQPRPMALVLNPFTALFKTYDTFQKP